MKGQVVGAAWLPGLPFVLNPEKSEVWQKQTRAMELIGKEVERLKPNAILIYSTQWFSVLGTSFQVRPHIQGLHVDENWYEWGDLPFDFNCDGELGRLFAKRVDGPGFPTKTVDYEEFPIDTGSIVALRFVNPKANIPVSIVSSWVYADAAKSKAIGEKMLQAIEESGKKVFIITSSLLSTRYFTHEINPKEDALSNATDDVWNLKVLKAFESGELTKYSSLICEYAKSLPVDMQMNAYHWLSGILTEGWSGKVLSYGPQWGTGAAVVQFDRRSN